jgi:cytochrome bd-type quinol oxidase subunit 2
MADVIFVIMRWMHIASVATLVGGMIFGCMVMAQAAAGLSPESRESFMDRAAAFYRPLVFSAMGGLLISGTYNIITNPGHTPLYHMLLGIKLLLVMHIFAVAILISRPHNPRRTRMMTGAAISGLVIIAISAYLRHIF